MFPRGKDPSTAVDQKMLGIFLVTEDKALMKARHTVDFSLTVTNHSNPAMSLAKGTQSALMPLQSYIGHT